MIRWDLYPDPRALTLAGSGKASQRTRCPCWIVQIKNKGMWRSLEARATVSPTRAGPVLFIVVSLVSRTV